MGGRLLLDGYGRGQPFDMIDVRFFHHGQELTRIGRQRLDVAPLSFRVEGVEGQRRLAGAGQARDDDEFVARDVQIDAAKIVRAGAANRNRIHLGFREASPAK